MISIQYIAFLCIFCSLELTSLSYFKINYLEKEFVITTQDLKNGYVIEYLDEYFNIILNRKYARFYRYIYFDNDLRIGTKFSFKRKQSLEIVGNRPTNDSAILLDGIYRVREKKGRLISEESYNDGKLVYAKSFDKSGKPNEFIDYCAKYENQEGSYTITTYENYPEPQEIYYYGKLKGKWTLIKRFAK